MLRTVEADVLNSAAEVLSRTEAREALDGIARALAEGGPWSPVGHEEIQILRRGAAWRALASLAGPAEQEEAAALLLLEEARGQRSERELADRELYRALAQMDWDRFSPSTQDSWGEFAMDAATDLPTTASYVAELVGGTVNVRDARALDSVVDWTNARLRGRGRGTDLPTGAPDVLRGELRRVREEAQRGMYSYGPPSAADVIAALLDMGLVSDLWDDLAHFLIDTQVEASARAAAFDRLAQSKGAIPPAVAELFVGTSDRVLMSMPEGIGREEIRPFPAALRFLGRFGLIGTADLFDYLTLLAGSSEPEVRREASLSVAVLSAHERRPELMVLALPLSRDGDVEVRGHAGRALSYFIPDRSLLASVALRRLKDLLAEDGLRVPHLVLRGMADVPLPLPSSIGEVVSKIAEDHPARSVRSAALRLMVEGSESR